MTPKNGLQVPDSLTELDQWVLWRYEKRADAKPDDPPSQVMGWQREIRRAASTNFAVVLDAYNAAPNRFAGIGFVFSPEDPYIGIDVDRCLTCDGTVKPWARPILERFTDSYAEISPSGTGIKIWVSGRMPEGYGGTAWEYGDGRLEVYSQTRYFAVTGRHWGGQMRDIEEHTADIAWLLSLSANGAHKTPFNVAATATEKIPKGRQYDSLVSLAAPVSRPSTPHSRR